MASTSAYAQTFLVAFLRSYSQVLFSRSRAVGAVLLLATMVEPVLGLGGLSCVLMALIWSSMLGLSREAFSSGLYGYNALLLGLGAAHLLGPTTALLAFLPLLALLAVLFTAAGQAAFSAVVGLPPLTLPFVALHYALLLVVPGLVQVGYVATPPWATASAAGAGSSLLSALAGIFFHPTVTTGALLVVAVLWHSRVAALLLTFGALLGQALGAVLVPSTPWLRDPITLNAALACLALGGVYYVPSWSALLVGLSSAGVAAFLTVVSGLILAPWSLPPSILPFNLTVLLALLAMRMRVADVRPKAVDFMLGTPEENLRYFRTRVRRFGSRYYARFHLPFSGTWRCTQGVDGQYTHRGELRYAADFEVANADGELHEGSGQRREDYLCYRLPVLAVADGTVVRLLDGVPDNPIGQVDTVRNWGNHIVLHHGPRLYSVVGHLSPGSLQVREGQVVRQGQVLGLCGSSGRSPRPHLHFQLQASDRLGSPTLPLELHDVVHGESGLAETVVPQEGEDYRNLVSDEGAVAPFVPDGQMLAFRDESGEVERLIPEVDTIGAQVVRSLDRDAVLYFSQTSGLVTVLDVVGDRRSVLHAIYLALPRMPEERSPSLAWSDHLDPRALRAPWWTWVRDAVAPFVPDGRLTVRYTQHEVDGQRHIEGVAQGDAVMGDLRTHAVFAQARGLQEVTLAFSGQRKSFVRASEVEEAAGEESMEAES